MTSKVLQCDAMQVVLHQILAFERPLYRSVQPADVACHNIIITKQQGKTALATRQHRMFDQVRFSYSRGPTLRQWCQHTVLLVQGWCHDAAQVQRPRGDGEPCTTAFGM
jgi:hypothetical protein